MKIVVVASLAWSLVNFRGPLLLRLVAAGHEVIACAPDADGDVIDALAAMGVGYHQIPMRRANIDPIADLRTLFALVNIIRRERPDAVLAYTLKPILYAGIATRICGNARFHAMVSGLGYVYSAGGGLPRRILRSGVGLLFRAALADAASVIVFNRDDRAELIARRIIAPGTPIVEVAGSGVDLTRFPAMPVPAGPPIFLLVARLLREKGLEDFVAAARIVKTTAPDVQAWLLGPPDSNPGGIGMDEIAAWNDSGAVCYQGETRDVSPWLARASVIVLPSRYREGVPRVLLEALSTGRAVITTDAPGCRDTVEKGANGFLVPINDPAALADAMLAFVRDPDLAARMGAYSRRLARRRFAVDLVNDILVRTICGDRGAEPRIMPLHDQAATAA